MTEIPLQPLLDCIRGILDLHRHTEQVGIISPSRKDPPDELEDGGPLVLCGGLDIVYLQALFPDSGGVEHVHRRPHIAAGAAGDLVKCGRIAYNPLCGTDMAEAGDDRARLERPELHRLRSRLEVF